jgi:hypothetical protein
MGEETPRLIVYAHRLGPRGCIVYGGRLISQRGLLLEAIRQAPASGPAYLALARTFTREGETVFIRGRGGCTKMQVLLMAQSRMPRAPEVYDEIAFEIGLSGKSVSLEDGRCLVRDTAEDIAAELRWEGETAHEDESADEATR